MQDVTCPRGHGGSQVRKLSAIYRESSGTVSGLAATYQSELSQQVAPPAAPGAPVSIGCTVLMILGIVVGAAIFLGSVASGSFIAIPAGTLAVMLGISLFMTLSMSSSAQERAQRFRERAAWDEGYSCGQHDLVFVPGYGWSGPPTATLDVCRKVAQERAGSEEEGRDV